MVGRRLHGERYRWMDFCARDESLNPCRMDGLDSTRSTVKICDGKVDDEDLIVEELLIQAIRA
jgi:hypothetical protein